MARARGPLAPPWPMRSPSRPRRPRRRLKTMLLSSTLHMPLEICYDKPLILLGRLWHRAFVGMSTADAESAKSDRVDAVVRNSQVTLLNLNENHRRDAIPFPERDVQS